MDAGNTSAVTGTYFILDAVFLGNTIPSVVFFHFTWLRGCFRRHFDTLVERGDCL